MARHLGARTSSREGTQPQPRGHFRLRVALPLLALALLFAMPGIASATGTNASVAITPATGPVGTQVTVSGSKFTPGDAIQVGYAAGSCASGVTVITGATGSADANGGVSVSFAWPSAAGSGTYVVCVTDTTTGHTYTSSNTFQVASPAATITVPASVQSGQPVTVTGANFNSPGGGDVEILYGPGGSNGCATSAGTATVKSDGSFTFTFNAPFESATTTITIMGVMPKGSCTGSPVVHASSTVTVTVAAATGSPSPAVSPTATHAPVASPTTSTGFVFPPTFPPSPAETVVYCLIGLLLLLLLLLLVLLLTRRRQQNQPTTIRQEDRAVVGAQGGPGGVQSSIYAQRGQQRTPIAEEVTSVQEDIIDPRTGNPRGPNNLRGPNGGPSPRYGN